MALGLVYGCRLTIWRYLADEERSFLERIFPSERFTEAKAVRLSPQRIVEFAIRVDWDAPIAMFKDCVNLNKAYAVAIANDRTNYANEFRQRGGAAANLAMLESAIVDNVPAMRKMRELGGYFGSVLIPAVNANSLGAVAYIADELGGTEPYDDIRDMFTGAICEAAKNGNNAMIALLDGKGCGHVDDAIEDAARYEQLNTVRFIWEQLKDHISREPMYRRSVIKSIETGAASGGSFKALELISELSGEAPNFRNVFMSAVCGNKTKMMRWAKDKENFGVADMDIALETAAESGSVKALLLLGKWGVSTRAIGKAAMKAVRSNKVEILRQINGWNIAGLRILFLEACSFGSLQAMTFLKDLGADNFNAALEKRLSCSKTVETLKLLKEWGATNFEKALGMVEKGYYDEKEKVILLLRKWIDASRRGCSPGPAAPAPRPL